MKEETVTDRNNNKNNFFFKVNQLFLVLDIPLSSKEVKLVGTNG